MNRAAAPPPRQRHCLSLPRIAGIGTSHLPCPPAQAASPPPPLFRQAATRTWLYFDSNPLLSSLTASIVSSICRRQRLQPACGAGQLRRRRPGGRLLLHQVICLFPSGAFVYIGCFTLHQVFASTSGAFFYIRRAAHAAFMTACCGYDYMLWSQLHAGATSRDASAAPWSMLAGWCRGCAGSLRRQAARRTLLTAQRPLHMLPCTCAPVKFAPCTCSPCTCAPFTCNLPAGPWRRPSPSRSPAKTWSHTLSRTERRAPSWAQRGREGRCRGGSAPPARQPGSCAPGVFRG